MHHKTKSPGLGLISINLINSTVDSKSIIEAANVCNRTLSKQAINSCLIATNRGKGYATITHISVFMSFVV